MGNCWSWVNYWWRFQSSESLKSLPHHGSTLPSPSPMETSVPTSGDPVPPPPIDPSLSTSASGDPLPPPKDPSLFTSGDPLSSSSLIDAIKSIGEMYKKIDQEQIDGLVSFIETQLHKMNTPLEAGSSSSEGWLATVRDVTKLAAITIDTISTEAEKLSKSYAVKEMGGVILKVIKEMGEMHWALIGLSVAGYAAESYMSVGSTENECRELLLKILEPAKQVQQYDEQMPYQRENVCNAVGTIVEGAVICLGCFEIGKFQRFWSAKTIAEHLEKTNQQLRDVEDSLVLQNLKQSTMPRDQPSIRLLDFEADKDVFLSHSGKQKNFVRQLHRDLTRENVSCFFDEDDNSLPLAYKFPPLIFKAAETCKIAVLVLSKEFIHSKWPMLELSAFIRARNSKKNANVRLFPIFFMISPKDLVTKDSPEWQEWRKLEESNATRRGEWQDALKEVRSINGLHFGEGEDEVRFRDKVVKAICCLLKRIHPKTPKLLDFEPVGIEEQVAEVKALMNMEGAQAALAVILCGFGGVGKSTIADAVVQSLDWSSIDFKFCCVAIDERAQDKTSHIIKLQKNIIYNFEGVKLDLQNPKQGRVRIKEALQKNNSLLYVDNVVDKKYIGDLLPKDLSSGERKTKLRILVTSREEDVKAKLNISCKIHEVRPLSKPASLLLLSNTILQGRVVEDKDFDEKRMLNEIADACKGVPLLLSVFGEYLRTERDKESYQEALDILTEGNLDSYRDEDLGTRLMFVYHKIKNLEVREAFLDICIYFHGWKWNLVVDIVDFPNLMDLRRRMLVSKSGSGEVIVHDILRMMGMKDARLTRFLNYKELSDALENNLDGMGNVKDVKGISFVNDRLITIQSTKLEAMRQSLRVLMLGDWVTLDGSPLDKAFTNLRYLRVGDVTVFPFKDLSMLVKLRVFLNRSKPGMNLSHLPSSLKGISHEVPDVECDMFVRLPFQNLSSLKSYIVETQKPVELPKELHLPASLVDLHLNRCKNLPKDIGHLTALESLILDRSDLERLPQGLGKLKKLKHLSLDDCSKLALLSEELGMLSSLEELSINGCGSNWTALPESFGGLLSLQTLKLTGCGNLTLLPESFGELRIHSLELRSLEMLPHLPNSLGNMPLLKDLILKSCDSLMSLPNSFVQLKMLQNLQIEGCAKLSVLPEDFGRLLLKDFSLISCGSVMSLPNSFVELKMLETLRIIGCAKLSVLPEDFGRLRCLKHMSVAECHLLKELPHGFGALPALKTFSLKLCNSLMNLSKDFGELTRLEELSLHWLPLISRIPDGFGKLKKLRVLSLQNFSQLEALPGNFQNMATLEQLRMRDCPELDGAMMEKILQLPNCYMADIDGSIKLAEKWEHMQGEAEHPIVVDTGDHLREREAERAMRVAWLDGKYMEVKNGTDLLMERSSLLVGLEEGISATVALIMVPLRSLSHHHQTSHKLVEKARETAKANGSELQIVCARKARGQTKTEEEEREEDEGIRQILVSLGEGSCAIPSTEYKRVKILTGCCELYNSFWNELSFLVANVVDIEGRKRFEILKFTREDETREPEDSIQDFIESIYREDLDLDGRERAGRSESESVAGESKREEFMEALKEEGIEYLVSDCNRSKVAVDDLHGKAIGIITCGFDFLECIKLQQIYKDLEQKDSNFIAVWIPSTWRENFGQGSYTRLIQCMSLATFPHPRLLNLWSPQPRFLLLDEHGQIANRNALPLLLTWGVKAYPFTQHSIRESLSSMESESCLEFLLHGMNIVGRKPMKSKITFLYAIRPNDWVKMKCELEEITQIHGSFEVLYVGKHVDWLKSSYEKLRKLKQEYEDAIQDMPWPSLSFSDMIMFWYRCHYLASKEAYELSKESNIMVEKLHGLADKFYRYGIRLVVVDKDGVVTGGGYEVVQMICDGNSEGEGVVKEELMESLSRGECTPLVRTFFSDEIHSYPLHPQHPISCFALAFIGATCDVCVKSIEDQNGRAYWCFKCRWIMCGSCWRAYAKQQVEQILIAKDN